MKGDLDYLIKSLIEWYCSQKGFDDNNKITNFNNDNDFNITKIRMLIFFVATAKGKESEFLDNGNFEFYALPNGIYEKYSYDIIKSNNNDISFGKFNRDNFTIKNLYSYNMNNNEIDSAISVLKEKSPTLILRSPLELVNIGKRRLSYQSAYSRAEMNNKIIEKMSINLMKTEKQYYN